MRKGGSFSGSSLLHLMLKAFAMPAALSIASSFVLYQMATLAPASANALAAARPIPPPAPDMTAVLPLREKRDITPLSTGGAVLLRRKTPFWMLSVILGQLGGVDSMIAISKSEVTLM